MARTPSRPARHALCRALSSKLAPLALVVPALSQPALAAEQAIEFNIPPQPLSSALNAYADQANVQMSYPAAYAANLKSPGVAGRLSPQQALQKLLAGTGLKPRATANGTITLEKPAPAGHPPAESGPAVAPVPGSSALPAVVVTAQAEMESTDPLNPAYALPNAGTAMKTDTPIMETPFSVQVVPKQVLRDQQVVSVDKAVQNVAGVTRFC